jgi:hypothetical protein
MKKANHWVLPRAGQFKKILSLSLALLAAMIPAAQAAKVLFVQNGYLPSTVKMISILEAQGHDVTVWTIPVDGNTTTAATYASQGYELIIIDEGVGSGNVGASMRGAPIPVINWEGYLYSGNRSAFNADAGLVGANYADGFAAAAANGGLGADFGQIINQTQIEIINPSHPLAAGLGAGLVDVFNPAASGDLDGPGVISFAGTRTFTPNVQVVATTPDFSGGMCVWGVEAGVLLPDATTSQARWVHLPWNTTTALRELVEPSYFLFEASIAWALTNAQPVKIFNLAPEGGSFLPTNTVITCAVNKTNNAGSAVASGNIVVKVNGATALSGVTVTDGGNVWNVSFTNNYQLNQSYTVVVSAAAADGGLGARQTTFNTFDPDNFTWEAEDFNFDGGAFFDSIVLCDTIGGGTPGCYFDRISVTNVDFSEINFAVTIAVPLTNEVYRFGDLSDVVRDVYVDTFLTADSFIRPQYSLAGIPDYEVRNIAVNEWLNYTRTYPPGTYNIYARVASAAALNVQLDFVDDATTETQNLTKIGRFVRGAGTAGYEFVPLTDDTGVTPLVIELTSGTPTTIRATALSGGYTPNFYMLVPTAAPVNEPPTVEITDPTPNQVINEGTQVTIAATVSDDGSITNVAFYAGTTEPLTLLGNDTTASYSFPFTPPLTGNNLTYTIRVVASDNGGLTAQDEVQVKVIDPTLIIVKTQADAQLNEYNNAVQDTSSNGPQLNARTSNNGTPPAGVNEVIALRFDLGEYAGQNLKDVSLNLINFRNNSAHTLHYYGVNAGTVGLDNNGTTVGYTDSTWDEAGGANLLYSTMPGLFFDGLPTQGYDTNNVTDLGAAPMGSGNKAVVVSYGAAALETFVEGHPGNLVTILVDTDTQSTGQKRFASKEATALDGGTPTGEAGEFAPFLSFRVDAAAPVLLWNQVGNNLEFSWSGSFKLQAQTNSLSSGISGNWGDYPGGAASPVNVPIDPAQGTVFFRLAPNP